ncbi:MAG: NAD-dependent epimerase/dehydratase family protein [Opitutales bacterium]
MQPQAESNAPYASGCTPQPDLPVVALAGGSGFVGTTLRIALRHQYRWRALTRSHTVAENSPSHDRDNTEWHECDLYSLPQVEHSLRGAKYGIYLVHSMLPSSRLMQASFADLDLLLADNFIRAAEAAGIEHVVYLGGLIPDEPELSPHLASRLEVESVLRSRSVEVTVLRTGIIFGPGGSSMRMLINLVRRLPYMLLPTWTRSQAVSVDVRDIVRGFETVLAEPELQGGTYDIAGHDPMTYREMILRTARYIKGREPKHINLPFDLRPLSRLWVSLMSGVSGQLVGPLLESLRHDLRASPNALQARIAPEAFHFEASLKHSVNDQGEPLPNPRSRTQGSDKKLIREARRVRSVQRMPLPKGWDAPMVADAYGYWLTKISLTVITVKRDEEGVIRFFMRLCSLKLLELTPTPYSRTGGRRRAFYISGGLLARNPDPPGRFEFRIFPENGCLIAAVHGFVPRLPWRVYAWTQALVHIWVMRAFGRYLSVQEPAQDFVAASPNEARG